MLIFSSRAILRNALKHNYFRGVLLFMFLCILFSFLVTLMPSLPNRSNSLFLFFYAQHSIAFYLTVLFGFSEQNKHFPKQKFEAKN